MNTERQLRSWSDAKAAEEATLMLGDVALTWFIRHCKSETTWSEFMQGMIDRFGDNEHSIMSRVRHRKQQEDESVQQYADDMLMLFTRAALPESVKMDLIVENMKRSLRKQVILTIPTSVQQAIDNATILEQRSGITLAKVKHHEAVQHKDDLEHLADALESFNHIIELQTELDRQQDQTYKSEGRYRGDYEQKAWAYKGERYPTQPATGFLQPKINLLHSRCIEKETSEEIAPGYHVPEDMLNTRAKELKTRSINPEPQPLYVARDSFAQNSTAVSGSDAELKHANRSGIAKSGAPNIRDSHQDKSSKGQLQENAACLRRKFL